MIKTLLLSALGISLAFSVGGCGTTVPDIALNALGEADSSDLIRSVAGNVRCQLRSAVLAEMNRYPDAKWLYDWAAKVTLTLTVDEKSSVSPNFGFASIPSEFNFSFGGNGSSNANRIFKLTWFVLFRDMHKEYINLISGGYKSEDLIKCPTDAPLFISGNLKIGEGLHSGVKVAQTLNIASDIFKAGGPLEVIEHHVTFDLVYGANAAPGWSFANVSVNSGGALFTGSRTRTDDLIISMGPTDKNTGGRALNARAIGPSQSVSNSHLAAQIGSEVGYGALSFRR